MAPAPSQACTHTPQQDANHPIDGPTTEPMRSVMHLRPFKTLPQCTVEMPLELCYLSIPDLPGEVAERLKATVC